MAEWKKVIVSGSNISQLNNDANYVASTGGGIVSGSSQITMGGDLSGTANNAQLGAGVVGTTELGADAVTAAKLADSAVVTANIVDGNVTTAKLADDSVTAAKLDSDSVVETSIVDGSVSNAKLATNAVATSNIVDANVTEAKLASNAVTTAKINNGAVTEAKIGGLAVTEAKIGALAVTEGKIGALAVTAGKIGSGAVTTAKLGADSVDGTKIADDAVDSEHIADGAIDNVHFASATKTAISGAFTAVSGGLAGRITTLEGSDFTYDLNIQGDSGTGTISDAQTLDIAGGTDITTAFAGTTLTVNLDSTIGSDTTGNAGTATALATARTIGGVSFDGTANINLPGVNTSGNQDTSGNAATATSAAQLTNAQNFSITGDGSATAVSFNGTGPVALSLAVEQVQGVAITATQAGYVGNMDQNVNSGASPSFDDLTVTGDLLVQGTTTTISTTNLEVTDKFISLNDGGVAADGGIVIEGQGTAFGWDESASRWAFDFAGATSTQTSITTDAYAVAVVTTDDANYRKNGNIRVQSGDIFIYTE